MFSSKGNHMPIYGFMLNFRVVLLISVWLVCYYVCPVGDRYTGDRFTGDRYTGDKYTGDRYTGDRFTGDRYTGDRYTGDRYTGDRYNGDRYTALTYPGHSTDDVVPLDQQIAAGRHFTRRTT